MALAKIFAVVVAALLISSSFVSARLPGEAAVPAASPEAAMKLSGGPRGEDCIFAGHCETRYDCMDRCRVLGYSPTAVLCQPYIGGKTCCCLQ